MAAAAMAVSAAMLMTAAVMLVAAAIMLVAAVMGAFDIGVVFKRSGRQAGGGFISAALNPAEQLNTRLRQGFLRA